MVTTSTIRKLTDRSTQPNLQLIRITSPKQFHNKQTKITKIRQSPQQKINIKKINVTRQEHIQIIIHPKSIN